MAEENNSSDPSMAQAEPPKKRRRWAKRLGWLLAILITPVALAAAFFSSPIGKRFITDQIAAVAPASGLRFEVGRIEGDIFSTATLHDVVAYDPQGQFLSVPEVELDWRPLAWLTSGIDVRELSFRRGTLSRLPELLPGDPDAPLLPEFDIRVDRLEVDGLMIASGVAGEEASRADLEASVDIRSGRLRVETEGQFGTEDRISLLLDAMPDGDRFDLSLDLDAPTGGVITRLAGQSRGFDAKIAGEGTWTKWLGSALVRRTVGESQERLAAFQISNHSGQYGVLGQVAAGDDFGGLLGRALGDAVSLAISGTLEDSVFDGGFSAATGPLFARGDGAIDLAGNSFNSFRFFARLRDPDFFGGGVRLSRTNLDAELNGPFRDLSAAHTLAIDELVIGSIVIDDLVQQASADFDGARWVLPLDARLAKVVSGNSAIDPGLIGGALQGQLTWQQNRMVGDGLRLSFPQLGSALSLRGDTSTGAFAIAGPIKADGLALADVGIASGEAKILLKLAPNFPWSLRANFAGDLRDLANPTLADIAGGPITMRGGMSIGGNSPFSFNEFEAVSEKLALNVDGQVAAGVTSMTGSGRHSDYGDFLIEAMIGASGPSGKLVFADPLPSAGLKDVRLAIAPSASGFTIETEGGSLLGPFAGVLDLALPAGSPARIDIANLRVWQTDVSGALRLGDVGVSGDLALSGGGLDGTIRLMPDRSRQGFDAQISARRASFGGETPLSIVDAEISAAGSFGRTGNRIDAEISGSGLDYGDLFIGRFAGKANIVDGAGTATASIAGRRSDRFALKFDAQLQPQRIALLARGDYAGRPITMPRRAVLTSGPRDDGWRLAETQIGFGSGYAILEGALGGNETAIDAQFANMPLSLIDLAVSDLGFGGTISGLAEYRQSGSNLPLANARFRIDDFSRSGLILSSRPVDLLAMLELTPQTLSVGAVLRDGDARLGRMKAGITQLPANGSLRERFERGRLVADLTYDGPAESIWRLVGLETFDLTGPVSVATRVSGSLSNPRFNGSVVSDDLRVQSAVSGTDIADVSVRGTFAGSRLRINRFSGTAARGGNVSGSGTVSFVGLQSGRSPQIDIRAAVDRARLINANGLSATLTGPLRIVSDGRSGTIAGRLRINRASWELGEAAEDAALPNITTREINLPIDAVAATQRASAWRYLVDASASRGIEVDGLGLDSEWAGDIALRGTTDDPRIGGEARLVRGEYTFAQTQFELSRGRIAFDREGPINPQLDIEAESSRDGVNVTVAIGGNSQNPEVTFASDPSLPEEEILARLLFGGSITSLSATDALQLGAALASLRGGGGADPVNRLRSAIGLDQLRIVSADPALNRGTGIALGKNIGRRFYVEIITDGRGYSATSVEYRITRWLALLGTVTTIGRQSVVAEVSRDY
ncbi:MAG: translocation/assembly module TamB domain-containing protein [Erythrobacter sp.]